MFDEIFKRWVDTGQYYENDLVPLLLEWNQVFGDGKASPQEAVALLNSTYRRRINPSKILKYVGIKKGYDWGEIYDKNGNFIRRFWNKSNT